MKLCFLQRKIFGQLTFPSEILAAVLMTRARTSQLSYRKALSPPNFLRKEREKAKLFLISWSVTVSYTWLLPRDARWSDNSVRLKGEWQRCASFGGDFGTVARTRAAGCRSARVAMTTPVALTMAPRRFPCRSSPRQKGIRTTHFFDDAVLEDGD